MLDLWLRVWKIFSWSETHSPVRGSTKRMHMAPCFQPWTRGGYRLQREMLLLLPSLESLSRLAVAGVLGGEVEKSPVPGLDSPEGGKHLPAGTWESPGHRLLR